MDAFVSTVKDILVYTEETLFISVYINFSDHAMLSIRLIYSSFKL